LSKAVRSVQGHVLSRIRRELRAQADGRPGPAEAPILEGGERRRRLMTVQQAKGLEFFRSFILAASRRKMNSECARTGAHESRPQRRAAAAGRWTPIEWRRTSRSRFGGRAGRAGRRADCLVAATRARDFWSSPRRRPKVSSMAGWTRPAERRAVPADPLADCGAGARLVRVQERLGVAPPDDETATSTTVCPAAYAKTTPTRGTPASLGISAHARYWRRAGGRSASAAESLCKGMCRTDVVADGPSRNSFAGVVTLARSAIRAAVRDRRWRFCATEWAAIFRRGESGSVVNSVGAQRRSHQSAPGGSTCRSGLSACARRRCRPVYRHRRPRTGAAGRARGSRAGTRRARVGPARGGPCDDRRVGRGYKAAFCPAPAEELARRVQTVERVLAQRTARTAPGRPMPAASFAGKTPVHLHRSDDVVVEGIVDLAFDEKHVDRRRLQTDRELANGWERAAIAAGGPS